MNTIDKITLKAATSIARTWRLPISAMPYLERVIKSAIERWQESPESIEALDAMYYKGVEDGRTDS